MSVRIEFTLTPEEFRAATRQLVGRVLRRRLLLVWVLVGLILVTMLSLVALSTALPGSLVEPGLLVLAAWLVALPVVWILAPRLAGREIAPAFVESTQFRADDESFSVTRETFSGSGSWEHFSSWRELPDYVVLAHSPSVILILPKRALGSDELGALRALLGRVISSRD